LEELEKILAEVDKLDSEVIMELMREVININTTIKM